MFGYKYPYDFSKINPFKNKQKIEKNEFVFNAFERKKLIAYFLMTRDYKSMDTDTLIDELNRFLYGNLR